MKEILREPNHKRSKKPYSEDKISIRRYLCIPALSTYLISGSNILSFASCVFCLICVLGCYGTQDVRIKVRVDSKVDMKNYRRIAVIDLVDSNKNSITEQGELLARMIRKQLSRSKEINILDQRSIYLDEEFNDDKMESRESLISISKQIGADALIVGTFDFYKISQPVPYIVESYSSRTGNYRPETRTYIQKVYRLLLDIKVVDGSTGEAIFQYDPSSQEIPVMQSGLGGLPISGNDSDPTSLRSMATKPIINFAKSLIPHYEYEQRILVR